MCQIASLLLLQRLKEHMSCDPRDFNNMETQAVIKSFFPARQCAEGNSRHSDRNGASRLINFWNCLARSKLFPVAIGDHG